ncbi:uncharacterized protein LOC129308344 [Prosopis cineraria]|uniref:uncharacterized protein LOC129308344 n=1 Tax=Prosopis cineraria TaxID=364024 RepID=UPI00240EC7B9|nr:uncharacterized protein LOC129308344 [Prosopis cineraria]
MKVNLLVSVITVDHVLMEVGYSIPIVVFCLVHVKISCPVLVVTIGLVLMEVGCPISIVAVITISIGFDSLILVKVGFEAPLLRKLADKVAAEGFLVVVPDLLYGDYFDPHNPQCDRDTWRKAHGTDKGHEDTKPLIAALSSKGVTAIGLQVSAGKFDSFVKIYPGVSHGWTVRYNADIESAVKSAEEAHQDMLNWFTKHIK